MSVASRKTINNAIEEAALPLSGERHDYDSLLAFVGNARLCLLGEATHGTHELWEHNSHLGDARATYMADVGELNVGQLVRQRYGHESFLVGFTTNAGTVTAASDWDGPAERKRVRPALQGSYENLFHNLSPKNFLLPLQVGPAAEVLRQQRLERAIGVIYLPQTERQSHYFEARLADQFDLVIHFDETRALEPLERYVLWESGEPPETFPTGV